jgi:hypothetical protein
MISSEVQRTLVKSPPELWALLSDPDSLAQHLVELGDIRIVATEPESAVEWEGQGVAGTVQLKASGWGTKVTITATRPAPEPPAPPEPEPTPAPAVEPEPEPRLGFFAHIFRRRHKPEPMPEPMSEPMPEPEPQEEAQQQTDIASELLALEESAAAETTAVLTAVLDRLGAAHHRPFSRA